MAETPNFEGQTTENEAVARRDEQPIGGKHPIF